MAPSEDPNHEHNGVKYHTGEPCVEIGCDKPAGTWWSHLWCQACNAERLTRVTGQLEAKGMVTGYEPKVRRLGGWRVDTVLPLEAILPLLRDAKADHDINGEQPGGCTGCKWCRLPAEWQALLKDT